MGLGGRYERHAPSRLSAQEGIYIRERGRLPERINQTSLGARVAWGLLATPRCRSSSRRRTCYGGCQVLRFWWEIVSRLWEENRRQVDPRKRTRRCFPGQQALKKRNEKHINNGDPKGSSPKPFRVDEHLKWMAFGRVPACPRVHFRSLSAFSEK